MSDALLKAIEAGDVDRVAKLLAAGADSNAIIQAHYYGLDVRITPLQAAVRELKRDGELEHGGPIDTIVVLLRYGADVNGRDGATDTTPLLMAVELNHIEAARLLLAAGADPNVRDSEGMSPLRFCVQKSLLEIARLLLLCGATKTMYETGGSSDMHALGQAVYFLDVEMVRLLLAHGADPNVEDNDRKTVFERLPSKERLMDLPEDPTALDRLRQIRQLLGDPPV